MVTKQVKVHHLSVITLLLLSQSTYAEEWTDSLDEYSSFDYLCKGDNHDHLLLHPLNCSKFIECSNEKAFEFECPRGLIWNNVVKKCDFPINSSNCLSGTTTTVDTTTPDNADEDVNSEISAEDFETVKNQENETPIKHPGCPIDENPKYPTHLPYPGDCTKFYKCDHGLAYALHCPGNLRWNSRLNICDWQTAVECNDNQYQTLALETRQAISQSEGPVKSPNCPLDENPNAPLTQFSYPGDCTKFYKCFNGLAYPQNCPDKLHWNSKSNVCDWPENAKCKVQYHILGRSLEAVSNINELETNPDCPLNDDPDNPTHLPYPGDCTKFYKCDRGVAVPQDCPPRLEWSTELNRCDWPVIAKCNSTQESDPTTLPPSTTTPTSSVSPPTTLTTSSSPSITNPDCPLNDDPDNPIHLPYPGDCTKFYKCDRGVAVPQDCPPRLEWSTELNRCDWPVIAKCNSTQESDPTTLPPSTTIPSTAATTSSPSTQRPSGFPNTSNACHAGEFSLKPYPHDCTKFIHCVNGDEVEMKCPGNLHFNAQLQVCDHAIYAGCRQPN